MAAGITRSPVRLLLFSLVMVIRSSLLATGQKYELVFPCQEDLVCLRMWRLNQRSTADYIAVATAGLIKARSERSSECHLPIKEEKDQIVEICTNGTQVPFAKKDVLNISLNWGKSASLQCVLLAYGRRKCSEQKVRLRWLDEAGADMEAHSEHRVDRDSDCNVTLTVTFKSPGIKKLRCQVTANKESKTSVKLWVKVPALKGEGRAMVVVPGPDHKLPDAGGKRDIVSTAVGVAGCAFFIAAVAAFVVRRKRRTRNQQPGGSESTSNHDNMIYADLILPDSSVQMLVREDTEYACIQRQ
ncbi:uncharacterized protein LOC130516069 isoform X2 [Takifugu flavidus]|uniref:uncharacterized protein LOC130516069 isoform X2 n=1 Tax=Takifugu flavidus TaxID=433684 RepID=UPI00254493E5|nr:uncharacterized protein LOC130516069 isoform X2 [Takifugu flavidus]